MTVRYVNGFLAAGTILLVAGVTDIATINLTIPAVRRTLVPALLVNAAALIAMLEGAVLRSGAIVGGLIGIVVYLGAGWEGWTMLAATLVCAVLASNAGRSRKHAAGISQEQEGRRGAPHVLANCGAAAAAAVIALISPYQSSAWVALVAALTAAGADTAASEIGKAWGRRTVLVVGMRTVPPGTPGAVSLEGTIANAVAALALASVGAIVGLVGVRAIPFLTIAAVAGSFVESVLAATLEAAARIDNHALNFINTAVAVGVALYLI